MYYNAIGIYFSATGNTKKYVNTMTDAIGACTEEIDVTTVPQPEQRTFSNKDFVVFGAPVYSGRIPKVARERFSAFRGNQTNCILVASYGNRDFDDALLEMADMAREQGFVVQGAAAVIGKHTFGEIQVDRPNSGDLAAAADFARQASLKVITKAWDLNVDIPGNRPFCEGGTGVGFHPSTNEKCTGCGFCVAECPVHAIADNCVTISDACLSCFRCISICPVHAKEMVTPEYLSFAKDFSEKLKNRKENTYFL